MKTATVVVAAVLCAAFLWTAPAAHAQPARRPRDVDPFARAGIAATHRSHLQRGAMAAIALILALVILESPRAFAAELGTTVPLAAAFIVCSMAAGWATSVPVTTDRRDRFTLAAEFGTRNFAAAAAIAVTMLGRIEFARFATTYFLTELPIMMAAIWLFLKTAPPQHSASGR